MLNRLIANWVYGGFWAGILLVLMAPLLTHGWDYVLALTFLHLPAYMLHQLEEHDDDTFRSFFNRTIGKGREVLSRGAVFVINVPGVWGLIAVSLYLGSFFDRGYALMAVYLVLINTFVHLVSVVKFRGYNPGTISAVVMFLPLGLTTLLAINAAGHGSLFFHGVGFAAGFLAHALILLYVKIRSSKLV